MVYSLRDTSHFLPCPSSSPVIEDPELFQSATAATASTPLAGMSEVKLQGKLPQGFIHFSLDSTVVHMTPLPSLSVDYTVRAHVLIV